MVEGDGHGVGGCGDRKTQEKSDTTRRPPVPVPSDESDERDPDGERET